MKKVTRTSKKKDSEAARRELEELQQQEEHAAAEDEFEFQKTCLEIRIKELEIFNLGLQRKSEYLESQNEIYKNQLKELKEEKDDLVSHLQRLYTEEKTSVKELEDRLYGTHQTMLQERDQYEQRLTEKDQKYAEMEEMMKKTIVELEAVITSLEEFRMDKEKLEIERKELEKTLKEERDRFLRNYDELENNTIRYQEKIKIESVEMVKKMAQDVQEAGKLCLTATVKHAIDENMRLQNDLETTSKDNLALREKIALLQKQNRNAKVEGEIFKEENAVLHKKSSQYKDILRELVDRQVLLQDQIERWKVMENQFINLEVEHKLCLSEEQIQCRVQEAIDKTLEEEIAREKNKESNVVDQKDVELSKLRGAIIKIALASKSLSEGTSSEEFRFLKNNFKSILGEVYGIAIEIRDPEVSKLLVAHEAPSVTSCVSYKKPQRRK